MINVGDRVRDRITGMMGIVIARTEWRYGCIRLTVQPGELKDGRPVDGYQLDEPQCEVVAAAVIQNIGYAPPDLRTAQDVPPVRATSAHGARPEVARAVPPSRRS